jgi:glycosyltransferase involved in cell wall biosynthesis
MINGFSVIICSYNPQPYIFNRVIKSINRLLIPVNINVEFIIVDNNSHKPLSDEPSLKYFLKNSINSKCVIEKKQGLTEARKRGFSEAKYNWIIFFDDDNEPEKNYLLHLADAIESYPEVACWGPANIQVELINRKANDWVQLKKELFQERNWKKTEFGMSNVWQDYFPYGTGLAVHQKVLNEYKKRIKEGRYNLSDRKGKSLSSGGDLQIVLTATNMGIPVGSVELMRINHLIHSDKSTIQYLVKQVYGTSSSYIAAHKQVDKDLKIPVELSSNFEIMRRLLLFLRVHLFSSSLNDFKLALADFFGGFNARYVYKEAFKKPFLIRAYEKLIHA